MQHEILIVSSRNVATLTIHQDFYFCFAVRQKETQRVCEPWTCTVGELLTHLGTLQIFNWVHRGLWGYIGVYRVRGLGFRVQVPSN